MAELKKTLHKNNKHKHGYDFERLILAKPELKDHVFKSKYGQLTINFSRSESGNPMMCLEEMGEPSQKFPLFSRTFFKNEK